jgi:hypothetical protein
MSIRNGWTTAAIAAALVLAACARDASAPAGSGNGISGSGDAATALSQGSDGRGVFHRYVAIGTSVSMGVQSDGVYASAQETSWPAQLARMAEREITQPYIDGTGCRAPLVAPLASGIRTSGEGAGQDAATLSCSALRSDVEKPVQNLAIAAARTSDALFTTPENITDAGYKHLYSRVLQSGQTQVSSMVAQNPKFVSVEFGGNEVLNARSGIAIPGATIVPVSAWAPLYDRVLDEVESVTKMAVVVGLIQDVATFPGFRRGAELYAERATFLGAFHVQVAADCDGSSNLLFVPVRVPVAVGTGLARRRAGAPPFVLSCAGAPLGVQDYVLTPSEAAVVNDQLAAMNAHIASQASTRGFAHFELESLYGRADLKPPFSVIAFMTSASPYGAYISHDGIHPNGEGSRIIAEAAAAAINSRYNLGISPAFIASR